MEDTPEGEDDGGDGDDNDGNVDDVDNDDDNDGSNGKPRLIGLPPPFPSTGKA